VNELLPIHEAQIMTYMKLANIKLGLLINFNVSLLKNGIKRKIIGEL
jgi:GxxExxY protein